MSKMSQLHAELTEQAARLGFESIEDAEAHGYVVDYESHEIIDGQAQAHRDWLREKEDILEDLRGTHDHLIELGYDMIADSVWHAIEFIKKGEM